MKWNNIKITIFKELRGIVRDKKSLHKIILYPLIVPIIILLFGLLFDILSESHYEVGIDYELSPEEVDIVKNIDNIELKKYDNKNALENAYSNDEIDGYIVKEDKKYTIYVDESTNKGQMVLSYASAYLDSYNQTLGTIYLIDNDINPNDVYNSILVESKSLSVRDSNILLTTISSLIVTYVLMNVILVCIVVVSDATSGEKERGTLETILTFPVRSSELVIGKYLATAILGFIVGVMSYLLSIPSFKIGRKLFEAYKDLVFTTKFTSILLVIFVILLTALLASGVCMALSGKAKTYKESQSSLQFVSIVVMIPYFTSVMELSVPILSLIPIANCGLALTDIVNNEVNFNSLLIIVGSTIVYTVIILAYISKQYKSEKTLFS